MTVEWVGGCVVVVLTLASRCQCRLWGSKMVKVDVQRASVKGVRATEWSSLKREIYGYMQKFPEIFWAAHICLHFKQPLLSGGCHIHPAGCIHPPLNNPHLLIISSAPPAKRAWPLVFSDVSLWFKLSNTMGSVSGKEKPIAWEVKTSIVSCLCLNGDRG